MRLLVPAIAAAAALLAASAHATPTPPASQSATAEAAAAEFLDAFGALDPARFDPLWAEDATLFFPALVEGTGGRITGKAAVLGAFHKFFAGLRRGNPAARLNIRPRNLQAQHYGDVAVLTFELDGGGDVGRRTLVMRKAGGIWQVAHLHGSSLKLPAPEAAPAAAMPASPALRSRADGLVALINGGVEPEAMFAPSYLAGTPAAAFRQRVAGVVARFGAAISIESIEARDAHAATVVVGLEKARIKLDIAIEPDGAHRLTELKTLGVDPR